MKDGKILEFSAFLFVFCVLIAGPVYFIREIRQAMTDMEELDQYLARSNLSRKIVLTPGGTFSVARNTVDGRDPLISYDYYDDWNDTEIQDERQFFLQITDHGNGSMSIDKVQEIDVDHSDEVSTETSEPNFDQSNSNSLPRLLSILTGLSQKPLSYDDDWNATNFDLNETDLDYGLSNADFYPTSDVTGPSMENNSDFRLSGIDSLFNLTSNTSDTFDDSANGSSNEFDIPLLANLLNLKRTDQEESGSINPESTLDSKDDPDFDIPSVMALLKWIRSLH